MGLPASLYGRVIRSLALQPAGWHCIHPGGADVLAEPRLGSKAPGASPLSFGCELLTFFYMIMIIMLPLRGVIVKVTWKNICETYFWHVV